MTDNEQEQLVIKLQTDWKGKFTKDDLGYWCRRFKDAALDAVTRALTEHRNASHFKPTVNQVEVILKRYAAEAREAGGPKSEQSGFKTVVATTFAATDLRLQHLDEAEVLVRYHRGFWVRYVREFSDHVMTWPKQREAEEQRLSEHEASIRKRCVGDLCAAGVDPDRAALLADGVFVGRENWDAWVHGMRSGPADVPVM